MANELQLLPNPTNIPEAVSSGYQRQNTNFLSSVVGLDLLRIEKSDNTLTVYSGGIVEVNGAIFKVLNNTSLSMDTSSNQYLSLTPSGADYVSLGLTTSLGTFDNAKNGYYSEGARIINIYDNPHYVVPNSITGSQVVNVSGNISTTYTAAKGWYRYEIQGGNGGNGGGGGMGGGIGGTPSQYGGQGGSGTAGQTAPVKTGIFRIDSPCILSIVSGGNGGSGGTGAQGGNVYNYSVYLVGGNGGNGGLGGNGGASRIYGGNIDIETVGGSGGIGGNGGVPFPLMSGTDITVNYTGNSGATGATGSLTAGGHVYIWKIA
jgi:hypothetical protein